jgi:glutathione S-transferase
MLKIWGRMSSSNVQKVVWTAEVLGLPYERIDAGLSFGITKEPQYLAKNPNALIPTIEDEDFVLWESNAICRYLCNKAAINGSAAAQMIYPVELRHRADVERWMDWSSTALAQAITPVFFGLIRTPPEQRDQASLLSSSQKTSALMAMLDKQLAARDFVCGEHLTLADVALGSNLYRYMVLPFEQIGYARPELPALQAWYERLRSMPAYQAHVVMDLV